MIWYRITRAVVVGCLAMASHPALAQGRGAEPPGTGDPRLDAFIKELRPYVPNHGTLTLGRGDTLIYSALLTGTRRIPLANVEAAIYPDSSRAGFRCMGVACIVYVPSPVGTSKEVDMLDQVTWGIGSVRRDADRQMTFQGDPGPFKRVTDALNDLLAARVRVTALDPGTISAASAAEQAIRQLSLELLNSPPSRWTPVVASPAVTVGIDLKGVRTENGYRVTWLKTHLVPAQQLPEGLVSTVFAEQRFDCAGKRTQVVRTVLALSQSVVARAKPSDPWIGVAANPTVRGLLDRVCAPPS